MENAAFWIDKLGLMPHPEGGFFRETYRSAGSIPPQSLSPDIKSARAYSTAIYFLLRSSDRSLFHKIKSDEVWHFYSGSSLTLYILTANGLEAKKLGNPQNGGSLQIVIPANSWFGALVDMPESFVLAGCTVAPGFDFSDFEIARRSTLLAEYPQYSTLIEQLTVAEKNNSR
jgi:uncharacterized protein